MAELLLVDEWADPGSLALHLREALPDVYWLVVGPTVQRQSLDAVVVGPRGLVVVRVKDWTGEVRPARRGPWSERLATGEEVRHPNAAEEAGRQMAALRTFLRDEFPTLQPEVQHLLVLTHPEARMINTEGFEPLAVGQEDAADAILSMGSLADGAWADEEEREALALALRNRRLTASQRAAEPFVFRSGGLFGSGKKVWTVRAAVRHMDRHPEDGIFHLRNGTLARWLSEQGAEHLAELAGEVMHRQRSDPRVPLEAFLLGTGLVRRPRIAVQPRRLNLGCVLSGEACSGRLRVKKGWGRGYLFGAVRTSEPWLRVEPRSFAGGALEAVVSADTEALPISRKPWQAEILVESSASEEAIGTPVRVRVMGMPSRFNRAVLRPLAGAAVAGVLGAGLGWALGQWGVGPLDSSALAPVSGALAAPWLSWPLALAALVGLFWAVLGGIRGLLQPPAWPVSYALGRWLVRTLAWAVALTLLAVAGYWAWGRLAPGPGTGSSGPRAISIVLLPPALAILPAVVGEIGSARQVRDTAARAPERSWLRPLLLAALGVALVLVLVAGALAVGPVWDQASADGTLSSAEGWAVEQWTRLEAGVDDLADQLVLRYYDRRAPPRVTPVLIPAVNPSPAP